ncbi:adenosylcobinamide-phosphate synthase CbiB [Guggenheimella bovis]
MMVAISLAVDTFFKDPQSAFHPIALIGRLISFLEKRLYPIKNKRVGGVLLWIFTVLIAELITLPFYFLKGPYRIFVFSLFSFFLLSGKTLRDVSSELEVSLKTEPIERSRERISMYVGRETSELSEKDIQKAVVETLAENSIDGIFAPFFYLILGELLGIGFSLALLYKVTNTLDSMVGYRNDKYLDFGRFSARFDDLLNLIPARIGSIVLLFSGLISGLDFKEGLRIFLRDRKKHLSPNSAHPESVAAGLLRVTLGGAHTYHGKVVEKPTLGDFDEWDGTTLRKTNHLLLVFELTLLVIALLGELL